MRCILCAQGQRSSSQPMILAQDCKGLHVFAGTWQSPANLYVVVGLG